MAKITAIKPAKTCYSHIGGKLGAMLMNAFADKGWIEKNNPTDKHFYITTHEQKEFTKLGIDLSQIESEKL